MPDAENQRVVSPRISLGLREYAVAWLEVESPLLTWGQILVGELVLQGGQARCQITQTVHAALRFYENETSGTLVEQRLSTPFTIPQSTRVTLPIRLVVPESASFGEKALEVTLSSGPWSPLTCSLVIQIAPPFPCRLAAREIASITGMQETIWAAEEGQVVCHLERIRRDALFDTARLQLKCTEGKWHGRLSAYRWSTWGWNVDRKVFAIPALSHNPQDSREQFEQLRNAAFRHGAGRDLPLPAGSPAAHDPALPLPAEPPPGEQPED